MPKIMKAYDFTCSECHVSCEHYVYPEKGASPERYYDLECKACGKTCSHARLPSAPAKYLADRAVHAFVHGGPNDTMGAEEMPDLPDLPASCYTRRTREHGGREVAFNVCKTDDVLALAETREWKDAERDQNRISKSNALKRERLPHLKAGTVDLRSAKLPGDPCLKK